MRFFLNCHSGRKREALETRNPGAGGWVEQRRPWVPDNACGVSGMTGVGGLEREPHVSCRIAVPKGPSERCPASNSQPWSQRPPVVSGSASQEVWEALQLKRQRRRSL